MAESESTSSGKSEEEGSAPQLRGPWWYSERRSVTPEQRREVLSQLFYEGADRVPFLSRFALLLSMAVLIALFGLARDSGPVVIGAMLISPLTTPILGLATALVLGHPRRQLAAFAVLLAATFGAIALAVVVTFLLPDPSLTTLSSEQLLARTEPDILDLAVAVIAGAAGAFILVRREAVSALPGVAIAVSLVPPLTTVGMTLELGRSDLAGDAMLLYLTNLAGIVLAAAMVMLLLGVGAHPLHGGLTRRVKLGLTTAAVGAFAVAVPLLAHTRAEFQASSDLDDVEREAQLWLAGTGSELGQVDLDDANAVSIEVFGPEPPPAPEPLASSLARELEEDEVELSVKWTPVETTTVSAGPG